MQTIQCFEYVYFFILFVQISYIKKLLLSTPHHRPSNLIVIFDKSKIILLPQKVITHITVCSLRKAKWVKI